MRPIKFRAWNKRLQYMGWVSMLSWYEDGTIRACEVIDDKPTFERKGKQDYGKLEDFIFMQYTGFNDKNGKEIYEGDIVKTTQPIYTWKLPSSGIFVVEWMGAGFYPLSQDLANLERCEVIGNIWENGELLQ